MIDPEWLELHCTNVSNKLPWSQRCSSHWGFTVVCAITWSDWRLAICRILLYSNTVSENCASQIYPQPRLFVCSFVRMQFSNDLISFCKNDTHTTRADSTRNEYHVIVPFHLYYSSIRLQKGVSHKRPVYDSMITYRIGRSVAVNTNIGFPSRNSQMEVK